MDKQVRQKIQSKKGRLVYRSPQSKDGVAEFIESTEGLVKTELKVEYNNDVSASGSKRKGTIKDSQIEDKMHIDVKGELETSYSEINQKVVDIKTLHVQTENLDNEYQQFLIQNELE